MNAVFNREDEVTTLMVNFTMVTCCNCGVPFMMEYNHNQKRRRYYKGLKYRMQKYHPEGAVKSEESKNNPRFKRA